MTLLNRCDRYPVFQPELLCSPARRPGPAARTPPSDEPRRASTPASKALAAQALLGRLAARRLELLEDVFCRPSPAGPPPPRGSMVRDRAPDAVGYQAPPPPSTRPAASGGGRTADGRPPDGGYRRALRVALVRDTLELLRQVEGHGALRKRVIRNLKAAEREQCDGPHLLYAAYYLDQLVKALEAATATSGI